MRSPDRRAGAGARGPAVRDGGDRLTEVAFQTDLEATRRDLAAYGTSWFRWLRGDYRKAMATLRGIIKGELPEQSGRSPEDHRRDHRGPGRAPVARRRPEVGRLGRDAFGTLWKGTQSDWARTGRDRRAGTTNAGRPAAAGHCRARRSRLDEPDRCQAPLGVLDKQMKPASGSCRRLIRCALN